MSLYHEEDEPYYTQQEIDDYEGGLGAIGWLAAAVFIWCVISLVMWWLG